MIVLDTHAWFWWVSEDRRLSRPAARKIKSEARLGVCAMSVWEVSMLVQRGRLKLDRDVLDWLNEALDLPRIELLGLTPEIAVRSTRLGANFHKDPADQLIVATAVELRCAIVTCDERIQAYAGVQTIW